MESELEQDLGAPSFVGEGEMPVEFDSINWGAFGFAPIWAIMYGPRRWSWLILGTAITPIVIENIALLFFDSKVMYPAVHRIVAPVFGIVWPLVAAYYAWHVDRWVWSDRAARFGPDGEPPSGALPLARYRKSRGFWRTLFVVLFAATIWGFAAMVDAGESVIQLMPVGVSVLAAITLFIWDRRRVGSRS